MGSVICVNIWLNTICSYIYLVQYYLLLYIEKERDMVQYSL